MSMRLEMRKNVIYNVLFRCSCLFPDVFASLLKETPSQK